MAEALLNKLGHPRFSAYSAGSHPTGKVHPLTIELLESLNYSIGALRSKSWMEYTNYQSAKFDLVITVCDGAASEACPNWPGEPIKAHWSLPDPASAEGSHADRLKTFSEVYKELERRIQHLIKLPPDPLDREEFKKCLEERE